MRKLAPEARKKSAPLRVTGTTDQIEFISEHTSPDARLSALLALAEQNAGGTMAELAASKAAQEAFYAEYAKLTANLSNRNEQLLAVALPTQCNADSTDVEEFIVNHWKRPVDDSNFKQVGEAFKAWFRETAPDEYRDPTMARFYRW